MKSGQQLVSVIVPAYNTAGYIGAMLECVLAQTYRNLEIIVVNDGSTDGTLDVVRAFAARDRRIVVEDIPNGGVSNARNVGIEKAHGVKFFFWDSDDIIEPQTVESCMAYSAEHRVSAVAYGYSGRVNGVNKQPYKTYLRGDFFGNAIRTKVMPSFLGHSLADVNSWIGGRQGMRERKEHTALWRIMCDGDAIRSNGLRFDTNLSLGEYTRFMNEYLLCEQSVGFLDECLYHLTTRDTGANRQSLLNIHKRLRDKIKLIAARTEIDNEAMRIYGIHTHRYWEGTLVFSGVEMALRLAKDKHKSLRDNLVDYIDFLHVDAVRRAYGSFKPARGLKPLPFRIIACGGG